MVSIRAGNTLDEAQQGLGVGDVGEAHFAVVGGQFEPVTICHQLTAFLSEPLFQLVPILSGRLKIRLLGEDSDNVHNRKPPRFGLFVVNAADFVSLKNGQVFFHSSLIQGGIVCSLSSPTPTTPSLQGKHRRANRPLTAGWQGVSILRNNSIRELVFVFQFLPQAIQFGFELFDNLGIGRVDVYAGHLARVLF